MAPSSSDAPVFDLVLITQEGSRPGELQRALAALDLPSDLDIRFRGFQVSELETSGDAIAQAVATADLLLLSHILLDEAVAEVQRLVRDHARPDANVLVLSSLRPVLELNRLGEFSFLALAQKARSGARLPFMPKGLFTDDDMTASMKELLNTAARGLKLMPRHKKDLRSWLAAMVFWSDPTPRNLAHCVLWLADHYGKRPGAFAGRYGMPEREPDTALYHPDCGVVLKPRRLPRVEGRAGTVGLLVMRGAVLAGETAGIDALIRSFEARGFRVLCAYARSFDFREPVERWFDDAGIDVLVNASGFPLVGGHNRCDVDAVREFLGARDLLYVTPPALMMQSVKQWERSRLGLLPMEVAMEVAISELEGGIEPVVVQGFAEAEGGKVARPEGVEQLVSRLERWVALRRKPNAEKKILLTVFSFPPGKGSVGTAAYLDVFRSAWRILQRLAEEGYDVEVPESPEALLDLVVEGDDKRAPIDAAGLAWGARWTVPEYERAVPESRRLEKLWGPPPGALDTDGRDLLVPGVMLGKVFVGVQPSFGFEGDPMRLLFEPAATPHHGFLAFYRWAEQEFGADAVVHLGTHGALEFMPGKQVGLSEHCWPAILTGGLPDIYLYAVNNPSEGTIAKRRGHAVTIGHLTPPADRAGLHREWEEAKELVTEFMESEGEERRRRLASALAERLPELHLDGELRPPAPNDPADEERFVADLYVALAEVASRRIPVGLHTVGRHPSVEEEVELVAALLEHDRDEMGPAGLPTLCLRAEGRDEAELSRRLHAGDAETVQWLEAIQAEARLIAEALLRRGLDAAVAEARRIFPRVEATAVHDLLVFAEAAAERLRASDELAPLVAALSGRHVAPGPGGDPVRMPEVLPVGRNLHALDPAAVPSDAAVRRAEESVALLLERRRRELGRWPRSVGMVLWGLDNIKTHGEGIAQAFQLLGVRPVRNSIGRVAGVEAIPLAKLGRPRIDVTLQASGIFRDLFGIQLTLLDRAVRLVASLEEPDELNFVRARCRELVATHGFDVEESKTRVFSNQPGVYGAHVDYMVGMSTWEEREDLADMFLERKGFAFGEGGDGRKAGPLLAALAEGVDTTFQNLDSSEVSVTDVDHYFEYLGGFTALVEKASGQRPAALLADATGSRLRMRDLEETVRLEVRTKLLNPKWYEGMLSHGFEGAEEIKKRFDYTFGWSATCEAVDDWVYGEVFETFVADQALRDRMREANLHAFNGLVNRLAEASQRAFWAPTPDQAAELERVREANEDAIEGVAP